MGMAGGVLLAQIAFGFGYAVPDYRVVMLTHTENLAANGLCSAESVLKIEFPAESFRFGVFRTVQFFASSTGI